jgi:bis(5'-nucleosidyl)-tetraphosphatase
LDEGETAFAAALRETREEAGLNENKDYKILNRENLSIVSNYVIHGVKPKQVTYWLAEVYDPNVKVVMSEEHQDFKWLNLSGACDIVGYEEMKLVLREAARLINENEN